MASQLDLVGQVALVTGGSRGIGAATAFALAEAGADVAFTYVNSIERAAELVNRITALGRRALSIQADSSDVEAVRAAVETTVATLGRLDVLVNNAGIGTAGPLSAMTPHDFDRLVAVNARAPFFASQAAVQHMPNGGRIISIGTNMSGRVAAGGLSLYVTTKSALVGMTRALARELGPLGITVNSVDPGSTDTDMNPADGPHAEAQRSLSSLGRFGLPEDVAATVVHLAGPGGRSITGASFLVDSGFNA